MGRRACTRAITAVSGACVKAVIALPSESVAVIASRTSSSSLVGASAQLLERWFVARQIVRPLLAVNVAYLALTALANVALVHGLPRLPFGLGFAGLGFEGAPLATGLCATARALGVWGYACAWRKLARSHEAAFSVATCLFHDRGGEQFICVGTAKGMTLLCTTNLRGV